MSKDSVSNPDNLSIDGTFSTSSAEFLALYRIQDGLFLRAGAARIQFLDDVTITTFGEGAARELVITQGESICHRLQYEVELSSFIENDPTPFVEDEHFDYGLFLRNVSSDTHRKERLFNAQ